MSRFDSLGMFWEDLPSEKKGSARVRIQPPIPDTGWIPPTYFPDLSKAPVIAIDTETYDPDLLTSGPGWARGVGHIVGISVAVPGGYKWYFPIRHEVEKEHNLDPDKVLAWLRDTLSNPKQPKVGANITYDVGWLAHEGVKVVGELVDVQFMEALLDETAMVNLEQLGQKYLNEGKESNLLYKWCADFYGGATGPKQRANIYRSPPRLVGAYAESDADLPLRLAVVMYPLMAEEGLLEVFSMECRLIPLMIAMRFAGVSVDLEKAEQLSETLGLQIIELHKKLKAIAGFTLNPNSPQEMERAFKKLGLSYGKTKKGNPSFTKDFIATVNHPIAEVIREIRKCEKIKGTFVESYILNSHINGKVYGQFHQLRSDDGGTRSGRFSSSTPNLQNIPSRDDILAPLVRGLFIPDQGHLQWRKYDYSQIEYRFLVHYGTGDGIEKLINIFINDPKADYHEVVRQQIHQITGILLERKPVKTINFGLIYGMGTSTLATSLGLTKKKSKELSTAYHAGAPFIATTMDAAMDEAQLYGIITTIMGRKSRFNLWEPVKWNERTFALPYPAALAKWGNIQRAHGHKALNRRLQGSAADLMKKAMLICWEDGVFDVTGVPRLTVHDELDFSDPGGKDEAFKEMKRIMESAIELKVPVIADYEAGSNWGNVKEIIV